MGSLKLLVLVGLALMGAACSSPPAGPPVNAAGAFTMEVDNTMHFGSPNLEVKAGQPLQLTLENTGEAMHDFTITDGVGAPVKIEAAAGQASTGTFTILQPGKYEFVCTQPGHALAGMKGTIVAD